MNEELTVGTATPLEVASYDICGIRVDDVTVPDVLQKFAEYIRGENFCRVVTPNVDFVVQSQKDELFRTAINSSALSLPDGMWLMRGARLLNVHFREGITGRKLVDPVCALAAQNGWSVYILASWGDTARRAADKLIERYPGLKIAGARSPSGRFGQDTEETEDILRELDRLRPDILFLGVGAPKSEKWMLRHAPRIPAKVGIGVGYAFDVIAGDVQECPAWMTRAGIEWLYRLTKEPRRLWRRYLVRDPYYFYLIFKQRFAGPSTVWSPHAVPDRHHHHA